MKICPLMIMGRSKSELSYIRGAVGREDDGVVEELTCLKERCAWWERKIGRAHV